MSTEPTFGWPVPSDDDLLSDGAATIRDLAAAIAADLLARTGSIFLGEMRTFATEALVPDDWLVCDGSPIPAEYPALIAAIGATTPNLIDRVPMGGGTPLALGGSNSRTLTVLNLPVHAHAAGTLSATTTGSTHAHNIQRGSAAGSSANTAVRGNVSGDQDGSTRDGGTHTHTISGSTANQGSGTPLDTTPAHTRLVFAIYAGPRAE